jgi:hypothetical protein
MAKKPQTSPILLRWSDHVPSVGAKDPLGLGLRGSGRLASRLLYCITSITPRARYFSFIPWCVFDYQRREKGKPHALNLRDAIRLREQALTLGCIAHHKGEPCAGGSLVGSRDAKKWYLRGEKEANFRKLKKFSKNPALGAYFNSLVNLGFFPTEEPLPDSDEESTLQEFTFDAIELSNVGLDLAKRYDSKIGSLSATRQLAAQGRICSVSGLSKFGEHGGLCELTGKDSADRDLLRNVFFAVIESKGESHRVRRQSLLLILELCRQLSADNWILTEPEFASAVYFGSIANKENQVTVVVPPQLADIATRWRMFYFHHYMSVALEALFSWLVSQLGTCGLAGATVDSFVLQLSESSSVRRNLSEILNVRLKDSFGNMSPSTLFGKIGLPAGDLDAELSNSLDKAVHTLSPFAEDSLEEMIRGNEHLHSSTGLALPMILLATTLARYTQWDATNYGQWLANVASDPYLDLIPPLLTAGLTRRFGEWWRCTWKDLTSFVLSRYVIQQHQAMSYEKSWTGDRCLLQVDGPRIVSTGGYIKIGMGNARFGSAIQILTDLGLIEVHENNVSHLTKEGERFLKRELAKESKNEVS